LAKLIRNGVLTSVFFAFCRRPSIVHFCPRTDNCI